MEEKRSPQPFYSYLLYGLVALVAFFPSLFLKQYYYANDLLYQFVPFRIFLRDQLAKGHFPLWDPYFYAGQPYFANPNAMMCYPLNYLTLIFPIGYGLGVFMFIHMVLAASGMHFWLKSLRLSENACRMGALVFALSGIFWWELIHLQILAAYALFPWLMGCLERLFQDLGKTRWAFLSGLLFGVIFCCGGFQSTTTIFYTALAYSAYKLFSQPKPTSATEIPADRMTWKKIGLVLLFGIWGALPLLTHLVPAEEFSNLSNRRNPTQTYDNFNGTFSMKPYCTYEFLFPTLGLPSGTTIENANQEVTDKKDIGNEYMGVFGYLGIWLPFLIFQAFKRKEKRFLYFLLGVGVLSILTAWGRYTPLHRIFCAILPGMDLSRAPFRFMQAYVLLACVMLAYGYQTLEKTFFERTRPAGFVLTAGVYAGLFLIIGLFRPDQSWREMLALLLGMAGIWLWGLTKSWRTLGRWIFQTALVLPMLLSGWNDFSVGPSSNFNYEENFPAFSELKKKEIGRYFFDNNLAYPVLSGGNAFQMAFPENSVVAVGVRDINGYSPIYLKKVNEIKHLQVSSRLLCLRGLLFGQDHGDSPEFKHTNLGSVHLYEFNKQPSYLDTPYKVQVEPDPGKQLLALGEKDFDPSVQIVLDKALPASVQSSLPAQKVSLQYEVAKDDVDDQIFKVHMDAGSLVNFSEIAYPGWKAFIDGAPAALLTADYTFRALFIPAGSHQVEFKFMPFWVQPLLWLMVLWVFSVILYGLFLLTSRRNTAIAHPQTDPKNGP